MQYSLLYRAPEQNGVLKACQELGVTLIAYSPLCQGLLTGGPPPPSSPRLGPPRPYPNLLSTSSCQPLSACKLASGIAFHCCWIVSMRGTYGSCIAWKGLSNAAHAAFASHHLTFEKEVHERAFACVSVPHLSSSPAAKMIVASGAKLSSLEIHWYQSMHYDPHPQSVYPVKY